MNKVRKTSIMCLVIFLILLACSNNVQAAKSKINKSKVSLYVGKTVTLKVTGSSQKVVWNSSKKKVATVNAKGKVIAKKAGTAIITAKVQNKKYKCRVTVKNPYLNKESVTLQEEESITLKIRGTKAKKWSSSNNKVAVISSKGKVTAKTVGKSTIICKGKNGKSYKCKVEVTKKIHEKEEHSHEYTYKETKPTCVKNGVKEYVCKICGVKKTEYIAKTGHKTVKKITRESTCQEEGEVTYICKVCGETEKTEVLEKVEHQMEKKITRESTCQEEGEATYICKVCGETEKTEVLEKVEHQMEKKITRESTCQEEGEATYICKFCDKIDRVEIIEKTEHQLEEMSRQEATCSNDGVVVYQCKHCKYSYKETISATYEHDWVKTYVKPTCAEVGGTYAECKNCKLTFYEDIEDVLPHDYEISVIKATCRDNGYTLNQCKNCKDNYKTDYTEIAEHQYEIKLIQLPDCESVGIRSKVCKVCDYVNREVWEIIEPLGHLPIVEMVDGQQVGICEMCQEHLFTVQFHTRDLSKVNQTMSYMENNTIHCVPGLHMNVYLYEMTGDGTKGITLKLDNAKCLEGTTIVMDEETGEEKEEPCYYYENEVVRLQDERVIALEKGEAKLQICYEDEVIGEVPVSIDGYSLPEAVRQKLEGSTEDVTKGYTDRYVEMVDTTVAIFKEVTTEDMTKIEKVKALFRWMEDNIIYGAGGTILRGQKAWETLSTKKAVCGGYAETAMFFMDVLEVPSYYLISQPPSGEGHAWNMIYIDTGNGKGENWYYIDTTWGEYDFTTTVDEMNAKNAIPGLWGLHRAMSGYQYGVGRYMGSSIGTKNIDKSYVSPLYE